MSLLDDEFKLGKLSNLGHGSGVYIPVPRHDYQWLCEMAKRNIEQSMEDSEFKRAWLCRINPGDKVTIQDKLNIHIEGRGSLFWEGIDTNHQFKDKWR